MTKRESTPEYLTCATGNRFYSPRVKQRNTAACLLAEFVSLTLILDVSTPTTSLSSPKLAAEVSKVIKYAHSWHLSLLAGCGGSQCVVSGSEIFISNGAEKGARMMFGSSNMQAAEISLNHCFTAGVRNRVGSCMGSVSFTSPSGFYSPSREVCLEDQACCSK